MTLSKEDIQEFMRLYKQEFDEELSFEEGSEMAQRVADLYCLLYSPTPREVEEMEKRRSKD